MPPTPTKQNARPPGLGRAPTTRRGVTPTPALEGVLAKIQPITFEDKGLKLLVYGQSGSGKTTFWSTFPGPILCLIASGGTTHPGELRSLNTPLLRKKVKTIPLAHTSEVRVIVEHIQETGSYTTVVLDHASGLQDMTLREVLGLERLPAQKSWGMASQQHYGQSAAMCKELMRALLELNCNVVIVAQERTFGDAADSGGLDVIQPTVGPAMSPSVVGWLAPAVDYMVRTYKAPVIEEKTVTVGNASTVLQSRGKGVHYCLRTAPHDVYMTKFRVPMGHVLPEHLVNPTYDQVVAVIDGTPF